MNSTNPFEYLKIAKPYDAEPVEARSVWRLDTPPEESVTILASVLPDGSFVFGYIVRWADGRTSAKPPSYKSGRFHSLRDAQIYCLAYMEGFKDYFRPDTAKTIHDAILSLSQQSLFN